MGRIINDREERALVMQYAVELDKNVFGIPVDTARELLGHEAVEILTDVTFAGDYWNVRTHWHRGTVKYLTVLGFVIGVMCNNLTNKCEIIPFRQRAASSNEVQGLHSSGDLQTHAPLQLISAQESPAPHGNPF